MRRRSRKATRFQFHIWHLIVLVAVSAVAFAVPVLLVALGVLVVGVFLTLVVVVVSVGITVCLDRLLDVWEKTRNGESPPGRSWDAGDSRRD